MKFVHSMAPACCFTIKQQRRLATPGFGRCERLPPMRIASDPPHSSSGLLFSINRVDSVVGADLRVAVTAKTIRIILTASLLLVLIIGATPAHAFRCGNKIVIKNMHEQQVLNVCGEPTSIRHLGYTLRNISRPRRHGLISGGIVSRHPGFDYYAQEVVVTEYIYNFGPRKFMQRLVFEGGFLVRIESIGYGYREKRK